MFGSSPCYRVPYYENLTHLIVKLTLWYDQQTSITIEGDMIKYVEFGIFGTFD